MQMTMNGYQPKVPMKNAKVDIGELFKRKAEQQLANVNPSQKKPVDLAKQMRLTRQSKLNTTQASLKD